MLNFTIPMVQMMLESGKLTHQTGPHAMEELHHAQSVQILHVLRKCLDGEETHGSFGPPVVLVDAAQELKKKLKWLKKLFLPRQLLINLKNLCNIDSF